MKEQAYVLTGEFRFSVSPVVTAPRSQLVFIMNVWRNRRMRGVLVTDECQARCNIHRTQRL